MSLDIKVYYKNNKEEIKEVIRNELDEFLINFPKELLGDFTLDDYCLGTEISENSFSYALEYGTSNLGSIKGGSARKYGIYYSVDKEEYYFRQDFENELDGLEKINIVLSRISKIDDITELNDKEINKINTVDGITIFSDLLFHKIIYLYNSTKLLPIYNFEHLKEYARKYDIKVNNKSYFELNKELLDRLYQDNFSKEDKNIRLREEVLSIMWFLYNKKNKEEEEITKREALFKLLGDNGGIASLETIYNRIEQYYPGAKDSLEWKAGLRGILNREVNNKDGKIKRIGKGIYVLKNIKINENIKISEELEEEKRELEEKKRELESKSERELKEKKKELEEKKKELESKSERELKEKKEELEEEKKELEEKKKELEEKKKELESKSERELKKKKGKLDEMINKIKEETELLKSVPGLYSIGNNIKWLRIKLLLIFFLGIILISIILKINFSLFMNGGSLSLNEFNEKFLGKGIYLFFIEFVILYVIYFIFGLGKKYIQLIEAYNSYKLIISLEHSYNKQFNEVKYNNINFRKENVSKIIGIVDFVKSTFDISNIKSENPVNKISEEIINNFKK